MQSSKKRLKDYFSQRFGVNEDFWEEYETYEKGESIWITSHSRGLEDKFVSAGLRALRTGGRSLKPTTYVLQFLGDKLNRNVVELGKEELRELLSESSVLKSGYSPGYVALKYRNQIIGCGLKHSASSLRNQIPKRRAEVLLEILD